jgi:hypothetical protein
MITTATYAALLGLLFVALSVRTLRLRRSLRIAVGDAGNATMLRAMRVHSNFAEYVPFALLLIYLSETLGANGLLVHALCIGLLVGRLSHAYGVSQLKEDYRFRVAGMALTFTAIIVASLFLLFAGVSARNDASSHLHGRSDARADTDALHSADGRHGARVLRVPVRAVGQGPGPVRFCGRQGPGFSFASAT